MFQILKQGMIEWVMGPEDSPFPSKIVYALRGYRHTLIIYGKCNTAQFVVIFRTRTKHL